MKNIGKIQNDSFKDYMWKKIKRIYPVSMITCVVFTLLMIIYYFIVGDFYHLMRPTVRGFFSSMLLVQAGGVFNKFPFAMNYTSWYLAVLLICYIVAWLVVFVCKNLKVNPIYAFLTISMLGLGCLMYKVDIPFYTEDSARGYMSFFLGMILYSIYNNVDICKLTIISSIVLLCIAILYIFKFDVFSLGIQYELTYVIFPLILFVFLGIDELFKGKIWGILGGASFEIFLWHPSIIVVLELFMIKMGKYGNYTYSKIFMYSFTVGVAFWGILMFFLIERPINSWIDKRGQLKRSKE